MLRDTSLLLHHVVCDRTPPSCKCLAAKQHDELSADRVRHLPLMTGHAAWNDLRSIAPLGDILWNRTAAATTQCQHNVSTASQYSNSICLTTDALKGSG